MDSLCYDQFLWESFLLATKEIPPPSHFLGRMDRLITFSLGGFRGKGDIWIVHQTWVVSVYLRLSYIIAYYVTVRLIRLP